MSGFMQPYFCAEANICATLALHKYSALCLRKDELQSSDDEDRSQRSANAVAL